MSIIGKAAGGKNCWESLQRNALTALWREFLDDNSQGFTYHFNKIDRDNLDALYNSNPTFTIVDRGYFNRNVRNLAKRFATTIELEGARAKAKAKAKAFPRPREFLFYSTQYCISFYFFSHSFFKYYDMYWQQQQLQKKRETRTTTRTTTTKKKKNK